MQVQAGLPAPLHAHPIPAHQHQIRVNGAHSDSKSNYSSTASHSSPSKPADMHPYQQQQYGNAPPPAPPPQQQQQQHRQYSANQLPPMHPSMAISPMTGQPGAGMPGPSNAPHNVMYNPPPLPPPSSGLPVPQDRPGKKLATVGSNGKYHFALKVEQQPMRARMCGFGDKDRRPITPPPCIKLVITDLAGMPVFTDEVDGSFFVLQVDLWDEHASREVNIVRSSSTSPAVSISTASLTSYPPLPDRPTPTAADYQPMMLASNGQPIFAPGPPGYPPQHPAMQFPNPYYPMPPMPQSAPPAPHYSGFQTGNTYQSNNMYTRNLIGSLTVNASVLKDTDNEEAFWFVLQDLSVRTEGFFRLKMNFIDVGNPDGDGLNTGKAPVLASVFSDSFQVYSAKKFPGVIESTPLSKCFAGQGIKIPIRKDVKQERDEDDD